MPICTSVACAIAYNVLLDVCFLATFVSTCVKILRKAGCDKSLQNECVPCEIEERDPSDVGMAYKCMKDFEACECPSRYDVAVAKLIFERYHTVKIGGKMYAFDERGVCEDGTITCCQWCADGVKSKQAAMESYEKEKKKTIFF